MIRHLSNRQIDRQRWDAVVAADPDAEVYAYSWWLDAVSPAWEALIEGDYEALWPLPYKRRYGLAYVIRPAHTPQLGIYGPKAQELEVQKNLLNGLAKKISRACWGVRTNLSETDFRQAHFVATPQECQILDLRPDYQTLARSFHPSIDKNLRRATKFFLRCVPGSDDQALTYRMMEHWKNLGFQDPALCHAFEVLVGAARERALLRTWQVEALDGELMAFGFFFEGPGRVHLFTSMLPLGRARGAGYLLFDTALRYYAQRPMSLDFGGSSLPGVAEFNRLWGSVEEPHQQLMKMGQFWKTLRRLRQHLK